MLWEYLINGQLQHVFEHARQVRLQHLGALLEARICVHLDEPRVEVLVQNKVVAEQLKAVLALVRVNCATHRVERLDDHGLHSRNDVFENVDAAVRLLLHEKLLEPRVRQLIAILELSIAIELLLDGVISQMNRSVIDVVKVDTEFATRRAYVTFLKEVQVLILVEQNPDSDVEFAVADQKRTLDILLDDEVVVFDLERARSTFS